MTLKMSIKVLKLPSINSDDHKGQVMTLWTLVTVLSKNIDNDLDDEGQGHCAYVEKGSIVKGKFVTNLEIRV